MVLRRADREEEGSIMAWGILSLLFGILGLLLGLVVGVLGAAIYLSDRMARADQAVGGGKKERVGVPAPTAATVCPPDDLTHVVGIGEVFQNRLRQAGITTFTQLASMTAEEVGSAIDVDPGRIAHADWIGQAAALAATEKGVEAALPAT